MFTNYVPEPANRYTFGYWFLYVIGFNLVVNMIVLVYSLLAEVYRSLR